MYCLCVNVYCHRVTTQLQLIYRTIKRHKTLTAVKSTWNVTIMKLGSGKCMNIMTGNWIHYVRRKLTFDARKFCVAWRGRRVAEKRKLSSLWNILVWRTVIWATDYYGNPSIDEAEKVRHGVHVCEKALLGGRHVARDCLTLQDGARLVSRNVGIQLPTYAILTSQQTARTQLRRDESLKPRKPMV
jgi:hypothetical protein